MNLSHNLPGIANVLSTPVQKTASKQLSGSGRQCVAHNANTGKTHGISVMIPGA